MGTDVVYEDEKFLGFKDIEPKAALHILVIPKKHILSVDHLESGDKELMGELILTAQKIAKEQKISDTGYRLVFNIGKDAGQTIDHLHLHLLGGEKLLWA